MAGSPEASQSGGGEAGEGDAARHRAYWRAHLRVMALLLSLWFGVSYGCGILFAPALNAFQLGGFPLGFWFAQQGSIYAFVLLLVVYVLWMDRLDRRYGVR